MSLERRVEKLERIFGPEDDRPLPHVVICGGGRPMADEDRDLISEIVQARVRAAWPSVPLHSVVTADDVDAWRAGRTEEAIRGIGHRRRAPQP